MNIGWYFIYIKYLDESEMWAQMLEFCLLVTDMSTLFAEADNRFWIQREISSGNFLCYFHVIAKDSKLLFLILINIFFITFL